MATPGGYGYSNTVVSVKILRLFLCFSAVLVIIGLFYVLLVLKLLVVLCSFRPYAKIRSGEEQSLLDRRMRESELNYLGLRCIVPCTNDEAAIKAFKDIAGEGRERRELLEIATFCLQKF